jgi:hypothetical protein
MTIVVLLGMVLIFLILVPNYFRLSKVFRTLKILTAISLLIPILLIVWIISISSDIATLSGSEYVAHMFMTSMIMSVACIAGLALAWLAGYAYWLYAKKNSLFKISSFDVALMLIAAIIGWITTRILVMWMLSGSRH